MGGSRPSRVQSWASPASVGLLQSHVHTTFDVWTRLAFDRWVIRAAITSTRAAPVLAARTSVLVAIERTGYSKVADSAMVRISSTRSTGVDGEYVASRITIEPSTSRIQSSSIWPAPCAFRAGSVSPSTP